MTKQEIEKFIQGPGYVGEWITPSGLERGHVYLAKNGQVMLYLGISSTGLHVFYVMASCYMQCYYDDNYNPHMRIANQEWQITSIAQTVELSMTHRGDAHLILNRKSIPKDFWEFPCKDYEDTYHAWYQDSFGDRIGSIDVPDIDAKTVGSAYVRVKELVPGEIYYTGNGWCTIFVFLGRSTGNKFLWYNISNMGFYVTADAEELLDRSQYTSCNKRVKPLSSFMNDPETYDNTVAEEVLKKRPHVDMTKIDQHMLDKAAGEEL